MTNQSQRGLGILAVTLATLIFGSPAFAAGKHRLLGTWSVDVARIQQPHPPKSVTITLAEADEGTYKMTVIIERPDGAKSSAEGTFKPDGSASRAVGSLDVDIVSMTMPSDSILVMGAGMAGNPASTRVFSLADDGNHMIETIIRHQADGTPYIRTNSWVRQ